MFETYAVLLTYNIVSAKACETIFIPLFLPRSLAGGGNYWAKINQKTKCVFFTLINNSLQIK